MELNKILKIYGKAIDISRVVAVIIIFSSYAELENVFQNFFGS